MKFLWPLPGREGADAQELCEGRRQPRGARARGLAAELSADTRLAPPTKTLLSRPGSQQKVPARDAAVFDEFEREVTALQLPGVGAVLRAS